MLDWISPALRVVDKLLERTPDYDQKQKNRYFKIKERYYEEMAKNYPERDDSNVDHLRRELRLFVEKLSTEL